MSLFFIIRVFFRLFLWIGNYGNIISVILLYIFVYHNLDKPSYGICVRNNSDAVRSLNRGIIYQERGYEIIPSRDYSEYLYIPSDLIELKGKKFHSKRNFINGFNYQYEFRTYQESDREELFELLYKWSYLHIEKGVEWSEEDNWHSHVVLQKIKSDPEIRAIAAVIDDLEGYNCFADVLKIDGKIVGFALGEILPTNIGALYFEKGDIDYKGIYPVLDNLFCKKHFGGVKYINKQEDMGLEGLRKSKLSYNPIKLAERFIAKKV